ncbi:restriction endonuclease [Aquirufa ecclesiirivi]|uniref:Restriction endonuclease n=1 Tax=Aquirufa ecclesiirivi TaxID=2715124 RepID=A0ABT4JE16_9BACT|nr:restriction endonuclease [Aquirufa ecclesiirivi]MCZ2474535.1 restriction endonuclease [Aquirufa ecclesiirivi]
MKWQEYQEAVGVLYEQMSDMGEVRKNITIPDRVTGQPRQVDVWWEFQIGNHTIKILIDAKMRTSKLDIKDVEEILALAKSVKADKAIIVTNNEWTTPAEKFANHEGLDFFILTLDKATDLIVDEKWLMCQDCKTDCVVLDSDGSVDIDGKINWWLGGKCRSCKTLHIFCQPCGSKGMIRLNNSWKCNCDFEWKNTEDYYEFKIVKVNQGTDFKDPNQQEINFK